MDWFRCWNDIIDDPKLLRLTPAHRWVWMAVMVLANKSPKRGSLYVSERMPCEFDDLVLVSRESPEVVREALTAFESATYGMLSKDDNGAWVVNKWEKRQPKRDDVTSRTKAHKERARERDGNAEGTHRERDGNALGNAMGTPPDSDTDSEGKEGRKERASATDLPPTIPKGEPWHEHAERRLGHLSTRDYERAEKIRATHGLSQDLMIAVFDWCFDHANKSPMGLFFVELPKVGALSIRTAEEFRDHKDRRESGSQRPAHSGRNPLPKPAARHIDEFTDEDFAEIDKGA